MNSNAPGQFLGYTLQIPRALFHLLTAGPGDAVCVEFKGDILKSSGEGYETSEEDKSSINSNPLTDRSTDLWKTFFNWIRAIKCGDIDIKKTRFILYTNKSGKPGIVNTFDSATTNEEALIAISSAKTLLKDVGKKHDIWDYYNFVVNENENILSEVIIRFELAIGIGAGYEEIETELVRQHVLESQLSYLLNSLIGWLQKELTERIAAKQHARITWELFDKQFKLLFHRIRSLDLIDFTLREVIAEEDILKQVKIQPLYLKQLDAIECEADDVIEAVTDYLRAKVNRDRWIEDEIIDEDIATEFQEKLISFWSNHMKRINLTETHRSEQERGRLLLLDCKDRQETINNIHPPSCTIAGTYHALADELSLGWHPNWESRFNKKQEG